MTKRVITNYKDLLREKKELELQLQVQQEQIRQDIRELKEELIPLTHSLSLIGKFVNRDYSNPIMTGGANMLIDLVVKKLLLSRAGWITRLVVPFLLKNYSSHILAENKKGLWKKVKAWIWPGGKNGSPHFDRTDIDSRLDEKAN